MAEKYWATLQGEEFGSALSDRLEDADPLNKQGGGRAGVVRRCYQYYYGVDEDSGLHGSSQIIRGGEQGELAKVRVNHARSLVNTLQNLITSSKLVWSPRCVNVDANSIKQVRLAQQLLEYYFHEMGFLGLSNQALEQALGPGAGECFVLLDWNENSGDEVLPDPDRGMELAKTGDAELVLVPTWDVFRDDRKPSWSALDWVIVRRLINKWDVAARWAPEVPPDPANGPGLAQEADQNEKLRQRILEQPALHPIANQYPARRTDDEQLEVFYFFHKRTPAVPEGREALFLADGTLLTSGPAKLDSWPLKRLAVAELYNTPFPYTPFLEILGVQELLDSLETCVASNQTAFGTQYVVAVKDTDISPQDVTSGMRMLYVNSMQDAPQALQLTKTAPELFNHMDMLKKWQELLFGLNSVVRGEPQSGDQSGSALALLSTQALQQASTIQTAYLRFVEEIGDGLFEMLRKFLAGPKKLAIVGKGNAFLVTDTQVDPDALLRINRVQVDIGSPLSQTASGRLQMAQDLMQMQALKGSEQYLEVIETGKLEPMTQATSNQLLLIRSENEMLMNGQVPTALITDDHMLHMREHAASMASPQVRSDPAKVEAHLAHMMQHQNLYFTAPPGLLIMMGQTPPPPGMGPDGFPLPMVPPPEPSAPPQQEGVSAPGGTPAAPPGVAGNPAAGNAPVDMPRLPTNPQTGEQYDPATGGGAVNPGG